MAFSTAARFGPPSIQLPVVTTLASSSVHMKPFGDQPSCTFPTSALALGDPNGALALRLGDEGGSLLRCCRLQA